MRVSREMGDKYVCTVALFQKKIMAFYGGWVIFHCDRIRFHCDRKAMRISLEIARFACEMYRYLYRKGQRRSKIPYIEPLYRHKSGNFKYNVHVSRSQWKSGTSIFSTDIAQIHLDPTKSHTFFCTRLLQSWQSIVDDVIHFPFESRLNVIVVGLINVRETSFSNSCGVPDSYKFSTRSIPRTTILFFCVFTRC